MKTGPRGKANAKKNFKRPMGGFVNSASRSSSNEKVARFDFTAEPEPETPTEPENGGEGGTGGGE